MLCSRFFYPQNTSSSSSVTLNVQFSCFLTGEKLKTGTPLPSLFCTMVPNMLWVTLEITKVINNDRLNNLNLTGCFIVSTKL